ncbi:hypothetical protein ACFDTO_11305 [Microbacteriaceae bacterium 4G12]
MISKSSIALITAIGTLLAGVAAVLGLWVRQGSGGGTATNTTETTSSDGSGETVTVTSFSELADWVADVATPTLPATEESYVQYDDLGSESFSLKVPGAWGDHSPSTWLADTGEALGRSVAASADVDLLFDQLNVPGVYVATSGVHLDPVSLIADQRDHRTALCDDGTEGAFTGEGYSGAFGAWTGCGTESPGSITLDFAVRDKQVGTSVLFFFRLTDLRDVPALRTALNSLEVLAPTDPSGGVQPEPLEPGGGQPVDPKPEASHPKPKDPGAGEPSSTPAAPGGGQPTPTPEPTVGGGQPRPVVDPDPGPPRVTAIPDVPADQEVIGDE